MDQYPKITIVTPNYNLASFLEKTILSVVSQGYPNLEYIIIDGGSTDNSVEIIKQYEQYITYWISEPDKGMYDAIQKGFNRATGQILGWLNSDDMLHPNALYVIGEVFSKFQDVHWITGKSSFFDEAGRIVSVANTQTWNKFDLYETQNSWIQQESTFWTRDLYNKAGGLDASYKLAGDYNLWQRFFEHADLYSLETVLGGFRLREQQASRKQRTLYQQEKEKSRCAVMFSAADIRLLKQMKLYSVLLKRAHLLKRIGLSGWYEKLLKQKLALRGKSHRISYDKETFSFTLDA